MSKQYIFSLLLQYLLYNLVHLLPTHIGVSQIQAYSREISDALLLYFLCQSCNKWRKVWWLSSYSRFNVKGMSYSAAVVIGCVCRGRIIFNLCMLNLGKMGTTGTPNEPTPRPLLLPGRTLYFFYRDGGWLYGEIKWSIPQDYNQEIEEEHEE